MKIDMDKKSKIYIFLSTISLMLLFYSIWEIKPVKVDITDFLGLVSHFTLAYWLGFILIISLSIRLYLDQDLEKSFTYLFVLFVYGLFIFGVPIFAEENARYPWSYYPAGEVKTTLETGHIDSLSDYPLISYRSWPSTHIVSAYIINMTDIKIEDLIKYMPLFWITSVIFTTFSIGKRIKFTSYQSFLLSFLVLSSFWYFLYYYGPQSMIYLLFILFFLFIIRFDNEKDTICMILVFAGIVMGHLLTSIAAFSSFLFSSRYVKSIQLKRPRFIILFSGIFIAWYIYLAPVVFETGVNEFLKQIMNDEIGNFVKTEKYEPGFSLSRILTHYSKLSFLGMYAILMMIAIILYLKNMTKDKNLIKASFLFIIGVSSLLVFNYGAEIDDRIYIFSLVPMAIIMISSFNRKYLVVIMTLFAIVHLPAHYGSESMDMLYTSELVGDKFFAEKTTTSWKDSVLYYPSTGLRFYNNSITFRGVLYSSVIEKGGGYNSSVINNSTYMLLSKQLDNFMIYNFDNGILNIKDVLPVEKDVIYTNGEFYILKKVM